MRRRLAGMFLVAAVTGGCAAPPVAAPRPTAEPASAITAVAGAVPADALTGAIIFQSDREGRSKLFTLDPGTGAVTRWTAGADHHDVEPVWSPDGHRVAFASTRFDPRTFDLAVADTAAPETVRRLTTHAAFERQPAWARDGRSLFFASEQDGTQALFRVSLADGAVDRVSPVPERALMPAVAPDGSRLAYVMGGSDGLQVLTQDLASGETARLTRGADAAAWPAWSPDGTRLACVRLADASAARLEIIDVVSGATTAYVVDGMTALREPAWSPDGRFVVVAGAEAAGSSGDWDLVLIRLDPAAVFMRLTSGRGNDTAPSWTARR